jgi:dihydropteroate synthase-like protein
MHADWVRRKLHVPPEIERVVLPGWCQGDLATLQTHFGKAFERGPKDLRDLPQAFSTDAVAADLSEFDIEIIAEINHAPRLSDAEIMAAARHFRACGADVIDLGCIPGESWSRCGEATGRLRAEGLRVSIDSFDRREVEMAVSAGAELVLSCNRTNHDWAAALPAELVAIPDDAHDLSTLDETIGRLRDRQARFRIDPILEPIGMGFAASLGRYLEARRLWPDVEMLMGIGNVTELTEVDSAGVNMLLAGFCQEVGIRSVLTTEVINWCRSAVREFDLARRLSRFAVRERALPKHVDSQLLLLRDAQLRELGDAELQRLARQIKDANFRLFAERGVLYALNREGIRQADGPFELFAQLGPIDPAHAFYLGYELAKAVTALTLGKAYVQDEPLRWGFLTRAEQPHDDA